MIETTLAWPTVPLLQLSTSRDTLPSQAMLTSTPRSPRRTVQARVAGKYINLIPPLSTVLMVAGESKVRKSRMRASI